MEEEREERERDRQEERGNGERWKRRERIKQAGRAER